MEKTSWPTANLCRKSARKSLYLYLRLSCLFVVISGCSALNQSPTCPAGQVGSACVPLDAIEDESVSRSYKSRTWV